jgi:hypothetical protein
MLLLTGHGRSAAACRGRRPVQHKCPVQRDARVALSAVAAADAAAEPPRACRQHHPVGAPPAGYNGRAGTGPDRQQAPDACRVRLKVSSSMSQRASMAVHMCLLLLLTRARLAPLFAARPEPSVWCHCSSMSGPAWPASSAGVGQAHEHPCKLAADQQVHVRPAPLSVQ